MKDEGVPWGPRCGAILLAGGMLHKTARTVDPTPATGPTARGALLGKQCASGPFVRRGGCLTSYYFDG